MKIAILDDYQSVVSNLECFSLLKDHQIQIFSQPWVSEDEIIRSLMPFEAVVLTRERTSLTRKILGQLPNLKIISQTGRPGEHVDTKACTELGKVVLAGTGSPLAPAELTWSLIMSAQKRLPFYMQSMKDTRWQSSEMLLGNVLSIPRLLKNQTLGIFGLGKIGSHIANYGKAFGMHVLAYGRDASLKKSNEMGLEFVSSQDELFERSDILSVHLRLSKDTQNIISHSHLKKMKHDSLFVNTSRSQLVEKDAIHQCLQQENGPFLFALDVHDQEPSSTFSLYGENSRILATPHIGFVELQSFEMYYRTAFQNILNYLHGDLTSIFNA